MTTVDSTPVLPRAVRVSSVLLLVTAVLAAVMAVLTLIAWRHFVSGEGEVAYLDELRTEPAAAGSLRASFAHTEAVTTVIALVIGGLAYAIRRPWRRARAAAWVSAGLSVLVLTCGLNGDIVPTGPFRPDAALRDRLAHDLIPDSYPVTIAILALACVGCLVAAALPLLRTSAADFYRPQSWRADPRWTAFVDRQAGIRDAGDTTEEGPRPPRG